MHSKANLGILRLSQETNIPTSVLEKPFKAARVPFYEGNPWSLAPSSLRSLNGDRIEFLMTSVNQRVLLPQGSLIPTDNHFFCPFQVCFCLAHLLISLFSLVIFSPSSLDSMQFHSLAKIQDGVLIKHRYIFAQLTSGTLPRLKMTPSYT